MAPCMSFLLLEVRDESRLLGWLADPLAASNHPRPSYVNRDDTMGRLSPHPLYRRHIVLSCTFTTSKLFGTVARHSFLPHQRDRDLPMWASTHVLDTAGFADHQMRLQDHANRLGRGR